ncbi:hypothetical protein BKA23_0582 [Rudaeicoccus suwonensis]|uniref:Uncharacterized protein n=1 Tax=Rudaeicoccus suwonensis TaxID=657409 RepID=A0A561E871_9MICO|nr:hypothetical protein BKA23_0582 [Rudaeicoccus suwonensis]
MARCGAARRRRRRQHCGGSGPRSRRIGDFCGAGQAAGVDFAHEMSIFAGTACHDMSILVGNVRVMRPMPTSRSRRRRTKRSNRRIGDFCRARQAAGVDFAHEMSIFAGTACHDMSILVGNVRVMRPMPTSRSRRRRTKRSNRRIGDFCRARQAAGVDFAHEMSIFAGTACHEMSIPVGKIREQRQMGTSRGRRRRTNRRIGDLCVTSGTGPNQWDSRGVRIDRIGDLRSWEGAGGITRAASATSAGPVRLPGSTPLTKCRSSSECRSRDVPIGRKRSRDATNADISQQTMSHQAQQSPNRRLVCDQRDWSTPMGLERRPGRPHRRFVWLGGNWRRHTRRIGDFCRAERCATADLAHEMSIFAGTACHDMSILAGNVRVMRPMPTSRSRRRRTKRKESPNRQLRAGRGRQQHRAGRGRQRHSGTRQSSTKRDAAKQRHSGTRQSSGRSPRE